MTLEIFLSPDLEPLFSHFATRLHDSRKAPGDPFCAPMVVVPHFALQRRLQIELCRRQADATHIEWRFPDDALQALVRQLAPDSFSKINLITVPILRRWIFLTLIQSDSAILEDYLPGAQQPEASRQLDPHVRIMRIWALSEKLATLFLGYEYRRPQLIESWKQERLHASAGTSSYFCRLENKQMELYRALFSTGGFRDRLENETERRFRTLPAYAAEVFQKIDPKTASPGNRPPVFFFYPIKLSQVQLDILFQLSRFFRMEIYLQSFAPELLDQNPGALDPNSFRLSDLISDSPDERISPASKQSCTLPASWREPDRELLFLLLERQKPIDSMTLLSNPHPDLDHAPGRTTDHLDRIEIVSAPTARRQVEAVYQSILALLKTHPEWNQTDFAILYTTPETFVPILESVFEAFPDRLQLAPMDRNAARSSRIHEAVRSLFELHEMEFRRGPFFGLVSNPLVRRRLGVSADEISQWKSLLNHLGIFRLRPMKAAKDDPVSPYSWTAGLRRLKLGRLMKLPDEPTDTTGPDFYEGPQSMDPEGIGRLCETVDRLLWLYQEMDRGNRSTAQWAQFLRDYLDTFLDLSEAPYWEQLVRNKLLAVLQDLEQMENLLNQTRRTFQPSPDWIRRFVEDGLHNATLHGGGILTRGVTAGPVGTLSGVPFRVVYVLGLEEGCYPTTTGVSSLDLRQSARRIGDLSPEEESRWNLLEMIANTQNKVFLCYVEKDLQRDRDIQPCSALRDLFSQMPGYEPGSENNASFRTVIAMEPVEYLETESFDPQQEPSSMLANFSRQDRLMVYLRKWFPEGRERFPHDDIPEETIRLFCKEFQLPPPDDQGFATVSETTEVESDQIILLKHLAEFLKNPIESTLKRQLGLYDLTPLLVSQMPDEPLYSVFPYDWQLKTSIFRDCLHSLQKRSSKIPDDHLRAIVRKNYTQLQNQGLVAEADFALADQFQLFETMKPLIEQTQTLIDSNAPFADEAVMGMERPQSNRFLRFPEAVLTASSGIRAGKHFRFQGKISFFRFDRENQSMHVLIPDYYRNEPPTEYVSHRAFEAFLFYLAAVASELKGQSDKNAEIVFAGASLHLHTIYKQKIAQSVISVEPEQARDDLLSLLDDVSSESRLDDLPYDFIFYTLGSRKADRDRIASIFSDPIPSSDKLKDFDLWLEEMKQENLESFKPRRQSEALDLIESQPVKHAFKKLRKRFFILNQKSFTDGSEKTS